MFAKASMVISTLWDILGPLDLVRYGIFWGLRKPYMRRSSVFVERA
jgi:hypothetical protein